MNRTFTTTRLGLCPKDTTYYVKCACCNNSFDYNTMFKCSACLYKTYCSSKCQHDDWKEHKDTCILLKNKLKTLYKPPSNYTDNCYIFDINDLREYNDKLQLGQPAPLMVKYIVNKKSHEAVHLLPNTPILVNNCFINPNHDNDLITVYEWIHKKLFLPQNELTKTFINDAYGVYLYYFYSKYLYNNENLNKSKKNKINNNINFSLLSKISYVLTKENIKIDIDTKLNSLPIEIKQKCILIFYLYFDYNNTIKIILFEILKELYNNEDISLIENPTYIEYLKKTYIKFLLKIKI